MVIVLTLLGNIFKFRYVHCPFRINAMAHLRLQCSVNITVICTEKTKSPCNSLYFNIGFIREVWN